MGVLNSRISGSYAVADPDLQIGGGGGGSGGGRGRARSKYIFLRSFGPQFGLKIRGSGAHVKMVIFYLHGNRTRIRIIWTLVLSPVIILKSTDCSRLVKLNWSGQYLRHAHSHIIQAVAAVDNCLALIRALQHA